MYKVAAVALSNSDSDSLRLVEEEKIDIPKGMTAEGYRALETFLGGWLAGRGELHLQFIFLSVEQAMMQLATHARGMIFSDSQLQNHKR